MSGLEQSPGITVPGVNVPVPGERDAVDGAVANGGWIALAVLTVAVVFFIRWLWGSMAVRVVGALILGGTVVYLTTKGA